MSVFLVIFGDFGWGDYYGFPLYILIYYIFILPLKKLRQFRILVMTLQWIKLLPDGFDTKSGTSHKFGRIWTKTNDARAF